MALHLGDGDDASFMSDVSDVNPDELEKMIAGVDLLDSDLSTKPGRDRGQNKPSNLKSAAKPKPKAKVQFSKGTKGDFDDFDDDDDLADLLSDEDTKPKKKPVPITESQPPAPVVTEPPKTSVSANRSKTMKELFGLDPGEKSSKTEGQTQKKAEMEVKKSVPPIVTKEDPADDFLPTSRPGSASTTNKRQQSLKSEDDVDDLFGGLDDLKPISRKAKNDFMSDLFGGGSKSGTEESGKSNSKDFVLDDKYKKLGEKSSSMKPDLEPVKKPPPVADQLELPVGVGGRGRRRGNPTFGGSNQSTSVNPTINPSLDSTLNFKPDVSPIVANTANVAQPDWMSSSGLSQQSNPSFQHTNSILPQVNPTVAPINQIFPQVNPAYQPQANPSFPQQANPVYQPQVNPSYQQQANPNFIQAIPQSQPIVYQAQPVPPVVVYSNPVLDQSLSVHNDLMRQMGEFERQQQEQFQRDMEEQRRILEAKQREYKSVMDQQRSMAQDQVKSIQERQSLMMKQQQTQMEMMLKQIQAQMESEMRMKSELVRNHLKILSDIQMEVPAEASGIDLSSFLQQITEQTRANNSTKEKLKPVDEDLEKMYQDREDRLKRHHQAEIKEWEERLSKQQDRVKEVEETHRQELEAERERRIREIRELREEHQGAVDALRSDYLIALDKIKELKSMEMEAARESTDAARAVDLLLNQVSTNTNDLTSLQAKLDGRVSSHIDVREALLKQKDQQLIAFQEQLNAKSAENDREKQRLLQLIEDLETKMRDREKEILDRETSIQKKEFEMESERRKFETEKEITLARLEDERGKIKDQKRQMLEERSKLLQALEKEHQLLAAGKAKLVVERRLHGDGAQGEEEDDGHHHRDGWHNQIEFESMVKAFEDEKAKLSQQKKVILDSRKKLKLKKQKLEEQKQILNKVAKTLAKAEISLEQKIDEIESINQDSLCFREESRIHLEECQRLAMAREDIMSDVDNRLSEVQMAMRRLDEKREEIARERKRLLNTRHSVLCARCQNPLADSSEMIKAGMTNLGLRTAGDGQMSSSTLRLETLKRNALKDQEFLARESEYLQSICN